MTIQTVSDLLYPQPVDENVAAILFALHEQDEPRGDDDLAVRIDRPQYCHRQEPV